MGITRPAISDHWHSAGMDRRQIIGKRIRAARKHAGLTQVDLAAAMEMDRSHLTHAEKGETYLGIDKMLILAAETGADIAWLLGDGDEGLDAPLREQFEWNLGYRRLDRETRATVMHLIRTRRALADVPAPRPRRVR